MQLHLIFFLFILLTSCSMKPTAKDNNTIVLKASEDNQGYFEEHFQLENIIPIETTDSFLIADITKIVRLDNSFLLLSSDQTVSLIDAQTGKLKTIIQKRGSGPGESNQILDIAFDETLNRILVYNDYQKLVSFDMQGNFLSEIKIKHMYENITSCKGHVMFYNRLEGYNCHPYEMGILNLSDESWKDIGENTLLKFNIRSKGQQMVNSKRIWLNSPLDYNLYCIDDNKFSSCYRLELPNFKVDESLVENSSSNPMAFFKEVGEKGIVYSINSVRETDNHLIFRTNQSGLYFLNKDSNTLYKENRLILDLPCVMPNDYFPHDGADNSVVFVVSAEHWNKVSCLTALPLELKRKIEKHHINADDNPILFSFKEIA